MAHAHRPTVANSEHAAGTGAQQSRANAFAHRRGDTVERITFADAPQVYFDSGPGESNLARFAVKKQFVAACEGFRLFYFVEFRDSPLSSEKAPASAERA